MDPKRHYRYTYAPEVTGSPTRVPISCFGEVIGNTADEALEFAVMKMRALVEVHGTPTERPYYHTERLDKISEKNRSNLIANLMKQIDWDQGKYEL